MRHILALTIVPVALAGAASAQVREELDVAAIGRVDEMVRAGNQLC